MRPPVNFISGNRYPGFWRSGAINRLNVINITLQISITHYPAKFSKKNHRKTNFGDKSQKNKQKLIWIKYITVAIGYYLPC